MKFASKNDLVADVLLPMCCHLDIYFSGCALSPECPLRVHILYGRTCSMALEAEPKKQ